MDWGAAGVGIYCFYRGLAVGSISIVVPISALGVMVPVIIGLIRGEVLQLIQGCGIAAAVSVLLATLILKELLRRSQLLGVVIAIIGVVLISSG